MIIDYTILLTLGIFLALVFVNVVIGVYAERKLAAFMQDRMGPTEVGKWGILQLVADLLKLIQKEDITPANADRGFFKFAPILIFVVIFAGFAVLPFSPNLRTSSTETGVFLLLSIISLDILAIMMAGWASNNKYSLLGAMRSVAQIISYEVPLGLSVLCVVIISQSLDLQEITLQQSYLSAETNYLFGIKKLGVEIGQYGGFLTWNVLRNPFLFLVFIIFFIAALAECNRAPFDLPEAESELISGFHTEYSGFRWAVFMLSEYAMMLLVSIVGVILFFGGWNTPFPNLPNFPMAEWTTGRIGHWSADVWGGFWLLLKSYILIFLMIWVRWTLPRFRIDQLMNLSWKVLTPFALILLLISGVWRLLMI